MQKNSMKIFLIECEVKPTIEGFNFKLGIGCEEELKILMKSLGIEKEYKEYLKNIRTALEKVSGEMNGLTHDFIVNNMMKVDLDKKSIADILKNVVDEIFGGNE